MTVCSKRVGALCTASSDAGRCGGPRAIWIRARSGCRPRRSRPCCFFGARRSAFVTLRGFCFWCSIMCFLTACGAASARGGCSMIRWTLNTITWPRSPRPALRCWSGWNVMSAWSRSRRTSHGYRCCSSACSRCVLSMTCLTRKLPPSCM